MRTLWRSLILPACGALLGLAATAQAQGPAGPYPNRPLRFIVPYPSGGHPTPLRVRSASHSANAWASR